MLFYFRLLVLLIGAFFYENGFSQSGVLNNLLPGHTVNLPGGGSSSWPQLFTCPNPSGNTPSSKGALYVTISPCGGVHEIEIFFHGGSCSHYSPALTINPLATYSSFSGGICYFMSNDLTLNNFYDGYRATIKNNSGTSININYEFKCLPTNTHGSLCDSVLEIPSSHEESLGSEEKLLRKSYRVGERVERKHDFFLVNFLGKKINLEEYSTGFTFSHPGTYVLIYRDNLLETERIIVY